MEQMQEDQVDLKNQNGSSIAITEKGQQKLEKNFNRFAESFESDGWYILQLLLFHPHPQ